jgi:hypothetical protein
VYRLAYLFFLIWLRVVAIAATQNQGSLELRVSQFVMGALAAGDHGKSGTRQVCDQLSDFAGHS